MDARDLTSQARWWAGRWTARAADGVVRGLAPSGRLATLRSIERQDRVLELDFRWPSRFRDACLVASHVVAPPAMLTIPPDDVITVEEGHHWDDLRVHQVTRAVIDEQTALVFHGGRVLTASGHGWRSATDGALLSGAGDRVRRLRPQLAVPGPVTPVGELHNYGHFLLETVPRLMRIHQVEPRVRVLMFGSVPSYAREVLGVLGIAWESMPLVGPISADEVWLCDPTPTGWSHPDDMRMLRDAILARVSTDDAGPSRIFVSRRGLSRAPQDAHLLEEGLVDWGFTVVRPQELSFTEQVRLYAGATDVIADFGAGLSNTLVMPAGGRVFDVMTGEWWTPHFRQMAAMVGLQYRLVPLPASHGSPYGHAADALRILAPLVAPAA